MKQSEVAMVADFADLARRATSDTSSASWIRNYGGALARDIFPAFPIATWKGDRGEARGEGEGRGGRRADKNQLECHVGGRRAYFPVLVVDFREDPIVAFLASALAFHERFSSERRTAGEKAGCQACPRVRELRDAGSVVDLSRDRATCTTTITTTTAMTGDPSLVTGCEIRSPATGRSREIPANVTFVR